MGSDGQNWYMGLTFDQWVPLSVSGPTPAARYKHAAVTVDGKLYIVGGSRNGRYLSDIQVFDLKSLTWSSVKLNSGVFPATAGHNMIMWENKLLFLAGHSKGCFGHNNTSLDGEKFLVAFGGYNGKYNNEVYVMRPKPRDVLHTKILQSPAAEAAATSVRAAYALNKTEKLDLSEREDSNFKEVHVVTQQNLLTKITVLGEQKKVLESSLADVRAENANLRNNLEDVKATHTDLSKELQSVQGQVIAERSRCAKLEAQIGELQKMLESMQSIEEEVQALQREKSELERAASVQKRGSGGAWKWITR